MVSEWVRKWVSVFVYCGRKLLDPSTVAAVPAVWEALCAECFLASSVRRAPAVGRMVAVCAKPAVAVMAPAWAEGRLLAVRVGAAVAAKIVVAWADASGGWKPCCAGAAPR